MSRPIKLPPAATPPPDDDHAGIVARYRDELTAYAVGMAHWHAMRAAQRGIPTGEGWYGREALSGVLDHLDALGDAFWCGEGDAAQIAAELDQAIVVARLAACMDCQHEIMPGALADQAAELDETPLRRIAGSAAACHGWLLRLASGGMAGVQAEIAASREMTWATLEISDLLPALLAAEETLAGIKAALGGNVR